MPLMQSFADVPVTEEGVDTVAFLQASKGAAKIFSTSTLC